MIRAKGRNGRWGCWEPTRVCNIYWHATLARRIMVQSVEKMEKKGGWACFYTGDQESTLSGDMKGTMKFDLQESSLSCLRLSFKVCESATDFFWGVPKFLSPNPHTRMTHTHTHTHTHPIHQHSVAKTERQELPELEWLISLHLLHVHFSWNLRPGGLKRWEEKRCSFERGGWRIYVYVYI